jgi:DNA-binding IscR family transcriptional regulator
VNDAVLAMCVTLAIAQHQRDLLRAPEQEPPKKKKKLRSPELRPAPTHEIAERLTGNKRGLEQMMPKLAACGIVKGIRGPRGGHRLARKESEITLRMVYDAVAKPDSAEVADPWGTDIPNRVRWIVGLSQTAKLKSLQTWTIEAALDWIETREATVPQQRTAETLNE